MIVTFSGRPNNYFNYKATMDTHDILKFLQQLAADMKMSDFHC